MNLDGIKNEEDRLIDNNNNNYLKGSKTLKGIEDINEGGANIHNEGDTDKNDMNLSKKADTINSHKFDDNQDRPDYQSENDVKPNTILRNLHNNDNLTNKDNIDEDNNNNNNQNIIDIPEINNNPDLNNNNNIVNIG